MDTSGIRVLKTGICPSLSGKSKLTYEVGCDASSQLRVRVSKNSGTDFFSKDWVTLERVHHLLEKSAGKPITSFTLSPLFKGTSANTAGFLMAALKHEGLVQTMADKPRCYERADAKSYFAEVKALMGGTAVAPKPEAVLARDPERPVAGAFPPRDHPPKGHREHAC